MTMPPSAGQYPPQPLPPQHAFAPHGHGGIGRVHPPGNAPVCSFLDTRSNPAVLAALSLNATHQPRVHGLNSPIRITGPRHPITDDLPMPETKVVWNWTTEDAVAWLLSKEPFFHQLADTFRLYRVDGQRILELRDDELVHLGLHPMAVSVFRKHINDAMRAAAQHSASERSNAVGNVTGSAYPDSSADSIMSMTGFEGILAVADHDMHAHRHYSHHPQHRLQQQHAGNASYQQQQHRQPQFQSRQQQQQQQQIHQPSLFHQQPLFQQQPRQFPQQEQQHRHHPYQLQQHHQLHQFQQQQPRQLQLQPHHQNLHQQYQPRQLQHPQQQQLSPQLQLQNHIPLQLPVQSQQQNQQLQLQNSQQLLQQQRQLHQLQQNHQHRQPPQQQLQQQQQHRQTQHQQHRQRQPQQEEQQNRVRTHENVRQSLRERTARPQRAAAMLPSSSQLYNENRSGSESEYEEETEREPLLLEPHRSLSWTVEEDYLLFDRIQDLGVCYKKIAGLLPPEMERYIRSVPTPNSLGDEGMAGVTYVKNRKRYGSWVAKANIGGRTVKRSFSEGVFGYEVAKQKAILARQELLARKRIEESQVTDDGFRGGEPFSSALAAFDASFTQQSELY